MIVLREVSGLLFVNKPVGIATHAPDRGKEGLVELLSAKIGRPLKVCHRLDKETSGIIVFGLSDEATRNFAALLEAHQVEKEYLLVTDRLLPPEREITVSSHIRKHRGRLVSWPRHEDMNATTRFVFRSALDRFSLWSAFPQTGKPHQIRLHARELGINVLGDSEHAGSRFPRLLLHAARLHFSWQGLDVNETSPAAPFFTDLKNCRDERKAVVLSSDDAKVLDWLRASP